MATTDAVHLVDSSVLLDLINDAADWGRWSHASYTHAYDHGGVAINPLIYAEISVGFASIADLDGKLPVSALARLPLPWDAAFQAGKAYVAYRRDGGIRLSPMPDFYIGAHALVAGMTLVTRDPRRFRRHYPSLKLIAPDTHFQALAPRP